MFLIFEILNFLCFCTFKINDLKRCLIFNFVIFQNPQILLTFKMYEISNVWLLTFYNLLMFNFQFFTESTVVLKIAHN